MFPSYYFETHKQGKNGLYLHIIKLHDKKYEYSYS